MSDLIYIQLPVGYRRNRLFIEDVVDLVCEHFDIPIALIKGKAQRTTIADARHTVCYLCAMNCDVSLGDIGRYLGGRDHTTIMHGRDKIRAFLKNNDPLGEHVRFLQGVIDSRTSKKAA